MRKRTTKIEEKLSEARDRSARWPHNAYLMGVVAALESVLPDMVAVQSELDRVHRLLQEFRRAARAKAKSRGKERS